MADNIDHTTPSGDKDINFIKHEQSQGRGCAEGVHDFRIVDLIPSGSMTKAKMVCTMCNGELIAESPLNVNEFLGGGKTPQQEEAVEQVREIPRPQPTEQIMKPGIEGYLGDLYRADKEVDSFWDQIKRGGR